VPIQPTLTASEDSIKATLTVLGSRLATLQKEADAIQRAIDALQIVDALLSGKRVAEVKLSKIRRGTSGRNRMAIAEILREAGEALRISEIAKRAYEHGLILSKRGYRGVYATVATVLARNSKHVFMQLRRGTWDLRDRGRRLAMVSGKSKSSEADNGLTVHSIEIDGVTHTEPFTKSSTVHK